MAKKFGRFWDGWAGNLDNRDDPADRRDAPPIIGTFCPPTTGSGTGYFRENAAARL